VDLGGLPSSGRYHSHERENSGDTTLRRKRFGGRGSGVEGKERRNGTPSQRGLLPFPKSLGGKSEENGEEKAGAGGRKKRATPPGFRGDNQLTGKLSTIPETGKKLETRRVPKSSVECQ